MDCVRERRWIAGYVDGELGIGSRWLLRRHLLECADCFAEYERSEGMGSVVRLLPIPRSPKWLRTSILLRTSGARDSDWWPRWKVRLQNALRPLAVPAAGGVVTAVMLFGALMSHLWISPKQWTEDVPLTYFNRAWISDPMMRIPSPLAIRGDITVEAFIDDRGRMYDFRMIHLPATHRDELRVQLANALLTTSFAPATSFGRPVRGSILISYVQVEVKG